MVGEVETRTIFMPRNEEEQKEYLKTVAEWEAEGFDVMPGSRPVGVFQLVRTREPGPKTFGGMGVMGINEDACTIRDKWGRRRKLTEPPLPEPEGEERERLYAALTPEQQQDVDKILRIQEEEKALEQARKEGKVQ